MDTLAGLNGLITPPLARRGLMMSSLISGLTLAATRVEAQVIHTDSQGIIAGEVTVTAADGPLPGYYARPDGPGPFPIILVNEEIFGIHDYIKDVCRRLAKLGYAAIAVEIYARLADLSKIDDAGEIIRAVVPRAPDAQVMTDSDAAITYAANHYGDINRVAAVGFCRGGRNVWLYDAYSTRLKAAVAFYGPVGGNRTPIQPATVVDIAAQIHAPLLGLYGGKDPGIPVPDIEQAVTEAKAAGKTVELVIYPDAGHGFHADYRPSYRPEAAADRWARMLAWFKRYGV
jgi:carboxymethylenebutenolidase